MKILATLGLCLLAFACSEDEKTTTGTTPTASDLVLTPNTGAVGVVLALEAAVTVKDSDGDLAQVRSAIVVPGGARQALPVVTLTGAEGQKELAVTLRLELTPPVAGVYVLEVTAADAEGNVSQPVKADLTIE